MTERPGPIVPARKRRRVVRGVLGFAMVFLLVNVVLALGQWDRSPGSFRAGTPIEVRLGEGEERIVYLGADESEPLNFDFYPSDFNCEGRSPAGVAKSLKAARGDRLLDIWRPHTAVATLVADTEGTYVLSCNGREDAELLLARPALVTVGWASPMMALFLVVAVAIVAGVALVLAAGVSRARARAQGHRQDPRSRQ